MSWIEPSIPIFQKQRLIKRLIKQAGPDQKGDSKRSTHSLAQYGRTGRSHQKFNSERMSCTSGCSTCRARPLASLLWVVPSAKTLFDHSKTACGNSILSSANQNVFRSGCYLIRPPFFGKRPLVESLIYFLRERVFVWRLPMGPSR